MVLELSIEIIVKLNQEICALLSFFDQDLTMNPPQPFKSPLSRWLRRKFPHLLDDYDMLSDKPSQPSPLDVAPTDVHTRGSGESGFPVAPQANGRAPPYTSERSFHKSN